MVRLGTGSIGAAAALAAAAAAAQAPPPPPSAVSEATELARQIDAVARCLVEAGGDLGALAAAPGADGSVVPVARIAQARCPTEVFRQLPQPFYLRGAIAERLLLRDFAAIGAAPRHPAAPVFAMPSADQLRTASTYARTAHAMLDLGACVAEAEPDATYSFLGTPVGDGAEGRAFRALAPALAGCIPAGEEITLTLRGLRPFLAEAAYRTAVSRASAAAPAAR